MQIKNYKKKLLLLGLFLRKSLIYTKQLPANFYMLANYKSNPIIKVDPISIPLDKSQDTNLKCVYVYTSTNSNYKELTPIYISSNDVLNILKNSSFLNETTLDEIKLGDVKSFSQLCIPNNIDDDSTLGFTNAKHNWNSVTIDSFDFNTKTPTSITHDTFSIDTPLKTYIFGSITNEIITSKTSTFLQLYIPKTTTKSNKLSFEPLYMLNTTNNIRLDELTIRNFFDTLKSKSIYTFDLTTMSNLNKLDNITDETLSFKNKSYIKKIINYISNYKILKFMGIGIITNIIIFIKLKKSITSISTSHQINRLNKDVNKLNKNINKLNKNINTLNKSTHKLDKNIHKYFRKHEKNIINTIDKNLLKQFKIQEQQLISSLENNITEITKKIFNTFKQTPDILLKETINNTSFEKQNYKTM